MTIQPTSATVGELIVEDRACPSCGYNLKGLRVGGVCPECGATTTNRRRSPAHEGVMGEAPTSYLYPLLLALLVMALMGMSLPIVALLLPGWPALSLAGVMAVQIVAAGLWLGGLLVTMRRRPLANLREDQDIRALEWIPLRIAALGLQLPWALAPIVWWGSVTQSSALMEGLTKLLIFIGVAGWPLVAWHLSFLADWAGDVHLANRLRGAGWVLGAGSVVVGAMYLVGWFTSGFVFILYIIAMSLFLMWALSYVLFVMSIAQMALMVKWARMHQLKSDARDQRMAEKARIEQERAERRFHEHDDAPGPDPRLLEELERAQTKPLRDPGLQGPAAPRSSPIMPQIERHGDGDPYDVEE